ncbi:hypothetical protein [Arthrobacter sp. Bi83]|uniref:hypothetical protein n=1 Tax=Arthrobacter sp. Bi83 TaxID=2822353 RepID=UPI001E286B7D|nr:hypothetical protein [Arthrobacter sp. Bi83]
MSSIATEQPPAAMTSKRRRRRMMLIPLALIAALALFFGYVFLSAKPEPSVPLGASAAVPGGMARVNGVVPLEKDGWLPPEHVQALEEGASAGTHRVRVLVQFTALEGAGITLDSSQYVVTGLGGSDVKPLWTSNPRAEVRQGDSLNATMVFELPDKSIALVLKGPGGTRLSLGLSHHTGS